MTSHQCPATGCPQNVSPSMLMCRPHWYMVPGPLRSAVYAAWDGGQGAWSAAHGEAIRAAVEAVNAKLAASDG